MSTFIINLSHKALRHVGYDCSDRFWFLIDLYHSEIYLYLREMRNTIQNNHG